MQYLKIHTFKSCSCVRATTLSFEATPPPGRAKIIMINVLNSNLTTHTKKWRKQHLGVQMQNRKQQKIKNLPTENDSEEIMNVVFHAKANTSAVVTCQAS